MYVITPETFNYTSFLRKEYCNKPQQDKNLGIGEFANKFVDHTLSEVKSYSTLMTLLSRDIGGASFDIAILICKKLDVDPFKI